MSRIRRGATALVLALALAMAARAQNVLIATAGTELRRAPQSDSAVVATLSGGERLTVIEAEGDWSRVETWAHSRPGFIDRLEGWLQIDQLPAAGTVEILVPPGSQQSSSVAPPNPPIERQMPAIVAISGTPGLSFSGECQVIGENGRRNRRTFRGTVPNRYTFTGQVVSCRFEKRDFRGRLRADLYVGDELRAWARTLNPFNWVLVRTDGPWGAAAGIEGDKRVIVRGVEPSAGRRSGPDRIVPPLSGPMIPPLVPDRR